MTTRKARTTRKPDADPQADAIAAAEADAQLRADAAASGGPEHLRHITSGGEPPATDDVDAGEAR